MFRGWAGVCAVQANDVEVLILNPDAAEESPAAGVFLGHDIEHEAADVAEELAAGVVESHSAAGRSRCDQRK